MNKYLIYTPEGYCENPNGNEVCNFQVLGAAEGIDKEDAVENLLDDNKWILDSGYNPKKFYAIRLHDLEII